MAKVVVLKPINDNRWAGVINYKNCHSDLCPYYLKNGSRYTGFNSKENWEARDRIGDLIHTDLLDKSEFWATFFIRLNDEDLVMNLDDPYDELKYYFLKSHKDVKNSPTEMKAGARWCLQDENEEAKKANLVSRVKREAYAELNKMTPQDMRDALRLYGERSDDMTPELVESKLSEFVERRPERFKELWIDNKARKTQVLIERAVQKGIVRKASTRFLYGTTDMGSGIFAAIAWLDDVDHQDVKLAILKQLK